MLAVIVIIGVISTIAVYVTDRMSDQMKKHYYDSQLSLIIGSAKDYFVTNRELLPVDIGKSSKVDLVTLIEEEYLDPVYGYGKSLCTNDPNYGYVEVLKTGIGEYSYMVTLFCEGETFVFGNMKPLPPEIVIDADTTKWTNQDVVARIIKQDESHKIYCYREGEDAIPCSEFVTITHNTTLYVYALNKAGQKSIVAMKQIDNIDKEKPKITFLFSNHDGNEEQTVTLRASDALSGVASIHYTVRLRNGVLVLEDEVLEKGEVVLPFTEDNSYVIEATVRDKAGNETTSTSKQFTVIEKDVTPPTNLAVTLRFDNQNGGSYTSGTWTNKTIYHEYSAKDKSGIKRYECASSVNGPWSECAATGTDTNDINITRWVRAVDLYDNVSEVISYTVRIDKTPPTYKVSDSGIWSNIGNRVNVEASDPNGVKVKKWRPSNGSYQTLGDSFYSTVYRNFIYLEDSVGNSLEVAVYAKVDKTPPQTPWLDVDGTLGINSCKPTIHCSSKSNCNITAHSSSNTPFEYWLSDSAILSGEIGRSGIAGKGLQITDTKTGKIVYPYTRFNLGEGFTYLHPTNGTTYLWEIYAYDKAGNRSVSPMKIYFLYPQGVTSSCSN